MHITNHKVAGLAYMAAHHVGGEISPEIVILHDTAGRLEKGNSAAYLASNNTGKVSVHFVLERDGTITQLVPTNRRANHAGKSSFHGKDRCNDFSIGIEIVNPGKMTGMSSAPLQADAWWGQTFIDGEEGNLAYRETHIHGSGFWMYYTEAQITALIELLEVLFRDIPTLKDITTHWYVSPGRKIDTNPLFPLARVRDCILGHDDPADVTAENGSMRADFTENLVRIAVGASDTLNLRRWPSFNPNVIASIPDGAIVPVQRRGIFGGRDWLNVIYGGQEGWIVDRYATPVPTSRS